MYYRDIFQFNQGSVGGNNSKFVWVLSSNSSNHNLFYHKDNIFVQYQSNALVSEIWRHMKLLSLNHTLALIILDYLLYSRDQGHDRLGFGLQTV